jgi:DNA-binding NtrC family response regulator
MIDTVTCRPAPRLDEGDRDPPVLRLVYSPEFGVVRHRVYPLLVGDNFLGRSPEDPDAIAIPEDVRLSRHHAVVVVKATRDQEYRLIVRDLNSKNGTFVNRQRVERADTPLEVGDVLRAGDSFLVVAAAARGDQALPSLVGDSAAAAALRLGLHRLAPTKATVLLLGETGTGKEIAARALHDGSGRKGAFVDVNCAAVPTELGESLFFGTLRGAFTGASLASPGYFREADRGTLFLDEVGELPLALQAKLLRALETRTITPVGGARAEPVDVRVVAATNRDLLAEVSQGRFREDLYARLEDEVVRLPPLRHRREDIMPLFLCGAGPGKLQAGLRAELVEALLHHDYPRNVRELMKLAQHFGRAGAAHELLTRLCPSAAAPASAGAAAERKRVPPLVRPTREELEALLQKHAGVVQHSAEEYRCSARQLSRWIEEDGLDPASFRLARRR